MNKSLHKVEVGMDRVGSGRDELLSIPLYREGINIFNLNWLSMSQAQGETEVQDHSWQFAHKICAKNAQYHAKTSKTPNITHTKIQKPFKKNMQKLKISCASEASEPFSISVQCISRYYLFKE